MVKHLNNTKILQSETCPCDSSSSNTLSFLAKVTCISSFLSGPSDSLCTGKYVCGYVKSFPGSTVARDEGLSLGQNMLLEKEMATPPLFLPVKFDGQRKPVGLQSIGSHTYVLLVILHKWKNFAQEVYRRVNMTQIYSIYLK